MQPGDSLRYEAPIDLANANNSQTQLILLTGEGCRVLEVGPATGYVTAELERRGCEVTAIEVDPVAAERARPFTRRMIVADVEALDFDAVFGSGERFDVVVLGDVLEHLKDPGRVLRAIRGVLAEGGRVVASIPNVAHGSIRLCLLAGEFEYLETGLLDRTHLRFFTKRTIAELFARNHFRIEAWRPIVVDPFATEHGLEERRFPVQLVAALRSDPSSVAFQYVVSAVPSEAAGGGSSSPEPCRVLDALKGLQEEAERLRALESSLSFQLFAGVMAALKRIAPPGSVRRRALVSCAETARRLVGSGS